MSNVLDGLRQQVAARADWHLDSRQLQPGDVFLACPGEVTDGRRYLAEAVQAGAAAVLLDTDGATPEQLAAWQAQPIPVLAVPALSRQAAALAADWYGQPSTRLTVVAITGTNGKTSSTQWLAQALRHLGVACGVIGTLGTFLPDGRALATSLTTPDGVTLQRVLARQVAAGAQVVAIEASSIGLAQGRLDTIAIGLAGFTNLSRDHLDYHGDMAAYAEAKRRLFHWPGLRAAVINADDAYGRRLLDDLPDLRTVAYAHRTDPVPGRAAHCLLASQVVHQGHGIQARVQLDHEPPQTLIAPVLGEHNLENLLLVLGLLLALGHSAPAAMGALATVQAVPGRLQPVVGPAQQPGPLVTVDYAHTPEALERVLTTLRPLAQQRGGRLICLFGCGGNRDPGKRPLMGAVAARLADQVWLTSDNPRDEDPLAILAQIEAGRPAEAGAAWQVQPERAQAILAAIADAAPQDVVLLAGKGHETTQEVAGQLLPFRDAEWARLALWRPVLGPVGIDTRRVTPGALFVALRGERFDGNDFVADAFAAGAAAAVVASEAVAAAAPGPCFVLGDGQAALRHLAAECRRRFAGPVVAVTGSNGKTTTKEMIAAILRAWHGDAAVLATRGNLNNAIGLPLTLLELEPGHRVAVLELGMNHPGEIAQLASLARPTVALVNNAQREHQEFMHSVAAVAHENGTVLQALPAEGVAVFPGDDTHTAVWRELAGARRAIVFGSETRQAVHAEAIQAGADGSRFDVVTPQGRCTIRLPIGGLHNVRNALAATAAALALGCPLDAVALGLARFQPVAGRLVMTLLPNQVLVVDDTYNANPDSVRAAIEVLAGLAGPRVLVLGDMGEVGSQGPQMHAEVGRYARACGIERLWCLGEASRATVAAFGAGAHHATTVDEIVADLLREAPASVLFKGSRFMRIERVLLAYREAIADGEGGNHAA